MSKKTIKEIILDRRSYLETLLDVIETTPEISSKVSEEQLKSIKEELSEYIRATENIKARKIKKM